MMKITQKQISDRLEISQSFISQIFAGKKSISWPLAEKLSDMFPGKSIREWKKATPNEIKRAFKQLKDAA